MSGLASLDGPPGRRLARQSASRSRRGCQLARHRPGGLVSPAADLRGLSHRALRILGLVIEDWPDERTATALATTPQDVAESIHRCMHLLAAPSRTALAVRALREGLFLPRRTFDAAA
jgi:DNA-binding NarL/FixJ family response regulator